MRRRPLPHGLSPTGTSTPQAIARRVPGVDDGDALTTGGRLGALERGGAISPESKQGGHEHDVARFEYRLRLVHHPVAGLLPSSTSCWTPGHEWPSLTVAIYLPGAG